MERDPRCLLWDVREGADAILRFIAGKSADDYLVDEMLPYLAHEMLRAAVERRSRACLHTVSGSGFTRS